MASTQTRATSERAIRPLFVSPWLSSIAVTPLGGSRVSPSTADTATHRDLSEGLLCTMKNPDIGLPTYGESTYFWLEVLFLMMYHKIVIRERPKIAQADFYFASACVAIGSFAVLLLRLCLARIFGSLEEVRHHPRVRERGGFGSKYVLPGMFVLIPLQQYIHTSGIFHSRREL